jgi:hypothetical protein
MPTGANLTVAFAQVGRILAALGAGRHADAYELTQRLFDPASQTHHLAVACWLIGELAEAACTPVGWRKHERACGRSKRSPAASYRALGVGLTTSEGGPPL